jgi:hypothetical protein
MSLAVRDILTRRLDQATSVVVVSPEGDALAPLLGVPPEVGLVVAEEPPPPAANALVVVTVGPQQGLDRLGSVLGGLAADAPAVLLLAWKPAALPWPRVLDEIGAGGCQVVELVAVEGRYPVCAVLRRGPGAYVPDGYAGFRGAGTPVSPDVTPALLRRLSGELAFVSLRERQLRGEVELLAADLRTAQLGRSEAERVAVRADRRLQQAEQSTSMAAGRAVVAARHPSGAVRLIPRLIRIWRRPTHS